MRFTVLMIEQWSNATDMSTLEVNNVEQNQLALIFIMIEQWSNDTDITTI